MLKNQGENVLMYDFNTNEGYFLHLLKCSLKSEQPCEPPEEIDFQIVFEIAMRHDVENLLFVSIDKLDKKPDVELYEKWRERYYLRQRQCMYQELALEELIFVFTSAGIDCMPLKGSVIKNYYPNPDLRSMGDIDFLVREQNRNVVRDIMHKLGYFDDILDDGQVDGFKKKDVYVEVHYDFSAKNHVYHEIFTIDWDRLVPAETEHLYKMTLDDLYFFNVGHYVKNMHNKGMGLRGVVDGYVLWKALSDEQRQSVLHRFEGTDLSDFNSKMLRIADIWFDSAEDDGTLDLVQEYLIVKKTYGDEETEKILYTLYSFNSTSKSHFFLRRIFPTPQELYGRFNIKKKIFVILPFLWIARLFILVFGKKNDKWNSVKGQIDKFNSVNQADIDYERKVRQEFGLM